ncbi:MAG: glutamate racemase [Chloroflexi bacterium]|nr:glutamate racemase [Chloroflexota bacterium]
MQKQDPIGIFDSGVGGLTVMRHLVRILPQEHMVYFGDTARVPYGNKSQETVLHYTRQITRFLQGKRVKAIMIACNTASAYALAEVEKDLSIPIIGVIQPGAEAASAATRNGRIGIIGTNATIGSGAYETCLHAIHPSAKIITKPCPLFVPFVEEGLTDSPMTDMVINHYLSEIKAQDIDTLLLGCTHYPMMRPAIERYMGESVACIDPAANAAYLLKQKLQDLNLLNELPDGQVPEYRFYASDNAPRLLEFAQHILPQLIQNIIKIDIEDY